MAVIDALHLSSNPAGWRPLDHGRVIGVALHHTVTTISPHATQAAEEAHARAIDSYHVSQGWGGLGYHYLVYPSGRVYRVGWGQRAHVASRNHELVGIAWVGDLSGRTPSWVEVGAAAEAVADAWRRIGRQVPVRGHREWALPAYPTSCPGRGVEVIDQVVMQARAQYGPAAPRPMPPQEEDDMTPEQVRQLMREELSALSQRALGTPDLERGLRALVWRATPAQEWGEVLRLLRELERALERVRQRGDPSVSPPV